MAEIIRWLALERLEAEEQQSAAWLAERQRERDKRRSARRGF